MMDYQTIMSEAKLADNRRKLARMVADLESMRHDYTMDAANALSLACAHLRGVSKSGKSFPQPVAVHTPGDVKF